MSLRHDRRYVAWYLQQRRRKHALSDGVAPVPANDRVGEDGSTIRVQEDGITVRTNE